MARGRKPKASKPARSGIRPPHGPPSAADAARGGRSAARRQQRPRGAGAAGRLATRLPLAAGWAWLGLALILLAALAFNWEALRTPFFADDYMFLDAVRGKGMVAALAAPDPIGNFFRPLSRQLYFWVLGRLSGEAPLAFHVAAFALLALTALGLFVLARRLAGPWGGLVAAGFYALHYAHDVPMRWASCSQDLLAVGFAVWALVVHARAARWGPWLGALLYLGGVLSKETVLLLPVATLAMDRWSGARPWRDAARRAVPYAVAAAAWAALLLTAGAGRVHYGATVQVTWQAPVAAVVHFLHVALGFEGFSSWSTALGLASLPLLPWLLLVAGLLFGGAARVPERRELLWPLAWIAAAVVPTVGVAHIWSAYYYLFALAGAGLLAAALLAARRRVLAAAFLLLVVGAGQVSRHVTEYAAQQPWSGASHVTRQFIVRATAIAGGVMADLERLHPTLPHRATLFWGGLPGQAGVQAGGGALVRWLYRDPSLEVYYIRDFTRPRASHGPIYALSYMKGRLEPAYPDSLLFSGLGFSLLLSEQPEGARAAFTMAIERGEKAENPTYWAAWPAWALGDTLEAKRLLAASGAHAARGVPAWLARLQPPATHSDSVLHVALLMGAIRQASLEPALHGALADLTLAMREYVLMGQGEAWACRALQPEEASAWRRMGRVYIDLRYWPQAARSLERYMQLGGLAASADLAAVRALEFSRRASPGGDLARKATAAWRPSDRAP